MTKQELLAALNAALESNDNDTLEPLAQEAVSSYPNEAFGYSYLAESLVLEYPPAFPEAEVCLAKALEIEPKNIAYLARFAELKDYQGSFEDAQIMWTKVLNKDPKHAQALLAIGSFQVKTYQDYEGGLDYLNKAIAADSDNIITYLCRAEALEGLGKHEEALTDIDHVLSQGFDEAAAIIKIDILRGIGRMDDLFALYAELVTNVPDSFTYPFNYAQELLHNSRFDEAVTQFKLAIANKEEPEAMFYRLLGEAALGAKKWQDAIDALTTCLELDAEELESYYMLIQAKIEQKQYKEALVDLEILWPKAAGNVSLQQRLVLQKGVTFMGLGRNAAAEATFTPLAQNRGAKQKEALYNLGLLYHNGGSDKNGYKFMKMAKSMHYAPAKQYITDHFQAFIKEAQALSIKANETAYAPNEASPFLQKTFGKLWIFDDLESEKLSKIPANDAAKFKAVLDGFAIVMTEKGALIVSKDKEEVLTYRIKKEASAGALIEFLPLDYFPAFVAKVSLDKEGHLSFSREKNEIIKLKEQDLSTVPANLVANFQKYVEKEQVAYLGKKADAVLSKLL